MSWQVDGTGDVESQDVEWADEDWIKGLVDWLRVNGSGYVEGGQISGG